MLNFVSIASFVKLPLRSRILVVCGIALVLYMIMDTLLLAPQQKKISILQQLSKEHKTELIATNKALDMIESGASKAGDKTDMRRAALDELKKQIADVDTFFGKNDATTSQVRSLVKELLDANPRLTLVSLRTLPAEQFYSPDGKTIEREKTGNGSKKVQKIIYKHGVEVSLKGNYMELLSYMENLQKYPKRLFWAEARLDVAAYPDAVLRLVIYSLSDQSGSVLR